MIRNTFRRLRIAIRRYPLPSGLAVAAVVVAAFFLFRLTMDVVYWHRYIDTPIKPWMTVGYVGRAYGVDPRKIDELAAVNRTQEGRSFSLMQVAAGRGMPVDELIEEVEEAIIRIREEGREEAASAKAERDRHPQDGGDTGR